MPTNPNLLTVFGLIETITRFVKILRINNAAPTLNNAGGVDIPHAATPVKVSVSPKTTSVCAAQVVNIADGTTNSQSVTVLGGGSMGHIHTFTIPVGHLVSGGKFILRVEFPGDPLVASEVELHVA